MKKILLLIGLLSQLCIVAMPLEASKQTMPPEKQDNGNDKDAKKRKHNEINEKKPSGKKEVKKRKVVLIPEECSICKEHLDKAWGRLVEKVQKNVKKNKNISATKVFEILQKKEFKKLLKDKVLLELPCALFKEDAKNHIFHKECIELWLRRGYHRCPSCATDIKVMKEDIDDVEKLWSLQKELGDSESFDFVKGLSLAEKYNIQKVFDWVLSDKELVKKAIKENDSFLEKEIKNIAQKQPEVLKETAPDVANVFAIMIKKDRKIKNDKKDRIEYFFKPENNEIFDKVLNFDVCKELVKYADKYFLFIFDCAIRNDKFNFIQGFFKKENEEILNEISDETLSSGFSSAVENGKLEIVQEFFSEKNKKIMARVSSYYLESALSFAADAADKEKVFENIVREFFIWAAATENRDVMRKFFKEENKKILEKISHRDLCSVVNFAVKKRNDFFLRDFCLWAVDNEYNEIIRESLKEEDNETLEWHMNMNFINFVFWPVFKSAVKKGNIACILEFFRWMVKSKKHDVRLEFFKKISTDKLNTIFDKEILKKIPDVDLSNWFTLAAEAGKLKVIQKFFKEENREILKRIPNSVLEDVLNKPNEDWLTKTNNENIKKIIKNCIENRLQWKFCRIQ